jgi:20S proteasome alpha/beta subunit
VDSEDRYCPDLLERVPFDHRKPWERAPVTVCIAAVCRDGNKHAIVTALDMKLSSNLGSAETGYKFGHILNDWLCMMAGAESDVLGLKRCIEHEFKGSSKIDETNLVQLCINAVRNRKHEKADMFVSAKFGINYNEFMEHGKVRFSDDVYRAASLDIMSISINSEILICGFLDGVPYICEINNSGNVRIREYFATIGEGKDLSTASMLGREQFDYQKLERTLYVVYEAKRWAERIPSVGTKTIMHIISDGNYEYISDTTLTKLGELFDKFGPKKITKFTLNREELYERFDNE